MITTPALVNRVWALQTFGRASLGDARLDRRLIDLTAMLVAKPGTSIPQACGCPAATKAAYAFLGNARVSSAGLVAAAAMGTTRACAGQPVILVVQDTTTISLPGLSQTRGLGPIGDESDGRGLLLHSAIALREDGQPVGVLDAQIWAREPAAHGQAAQRRKRAFEDKESHKWVAGVEAARTQMRALAPAERPRLVHVMDREGDIHEVFAALAGSADGAVIRCAQNRRVEEAEARALEAVRSAPLLQRAEVVVPRTAQSAARAATVEVRAARLTLRPDTHKHPERRPVELTLVEVWEPAPPEGAVPLHWRLWTTEAVNTWAAAQRVVGWYRLRWRIEDVHLALKEGCRVEKLQLETAERLAHALILYLTIAVRVVALRDAARCTPEAPCTVVLSKEEWETLWLKRHRRPVTPGQAPPTLGEVILWIARLGGHQNRKGDGMPGLKTLWRGWRDLMLLTEFYVTIRQNA